MNARSTTLIALAALAAATGCGPKVVVATGTTLGLKATPGDGQTRPPQVTLGYKRAEVALVPTDGQDASGSEDAYSVMAAFDFRSEWFGKTELSSFIATGNAARDVQGKHDEFITAVAVATAVPVTEAVQARKANLIARWNGLSKDDAARVLASAGRTIAPHNTAKDELQDAIARANLDSELLVLENAFAANGL